MKFNIAVLPGDGIGPEISVQGVDVMNAVCEKFGHEVSYEYAICGADAIDKVGDPFPEETFQICKNADAVLFSAVGDPKFDNDPTAKVRPEQGLLAMRKKLGLFANIRPVQTFKCLIHKSPLRAELVENADFICIRELTGGMYFGEKYQDNEKAYDTNYYTRPEIERILKVGFEYAMKRNKHLTVVDKANVLASSRLWRQIAQEMAPQYPEVTTDYMYVDNAAMRMIQEPTFFDVMVTENTFGDILTDEGSVISGSMGLLPSASTGESTPVFEPIHGSWPQAKGLNIANPLAQILSVAMLFEYFNLKEEGALIRKAVDASLDANVRTPEIQVQGGEKYGTKEVGAWMKANGEAIYNTRITPNYNTGKTWFTAHKNGKTLYAIYALADDETLPATIEWEGNEPVGRMTLLKGNRAVNYTYKDGKVTVKLPKGLKNEPVALKFNVKK